MSTGISTSHQAALDVASRWGSAPPPADAVEIQNLLNVYALYSDAGRVEDLASLFTDDATWDGSELDYGVAEGPMAIAQRVAGHFRAEAPMMHLPGPGLLISDSADEAQSLCWCLATALERRRAHAAHLLLLSGRAAPRARRSVAVPEPLSAPGRAEAPCRGLTHRRKRRLAFSRRRPAGRSRCAGSGCPARCDRNGCGHRPWRPSPRLILKPVTKSSSPVTSA